jgi:hypothetical protein
MSKFRRLTSVRRSKSGRFDLVVILIVALLIVGGLIFVILQIVGHSEEHVEKVRNTKVIYKESLRWRSDSDLSETRISNDLNKCPNQKGADYGDLNLSENSLRSIGQMSNLKNLKIDRSTFKNEWLEYLTNLKHLKFLSLEGSSISDKGIPFILQMPKLRRLSIGDSDVTNEGLERLSAHSGLTHLCLNGDRTVTNDGIKHIKKFKNLISLELNNPTALDGKCLTNLADMNKLISLNAQGMQISADDLKTLPTLKNLASLDVSTCNLTDQTIGEISKIDSLVNLDLSGTPITAAGLKPLTKMKKLKSLELKDCGQISNQEFLSIQSAMPNCEVNHSRSSSLTDRLSEKDVKQKVDFLETEVQKELMNSNKLDH